MIILWLSQSLVDLDIGVSPPGPCYAFDEIPLPSSKPIWDADSKDQWETQYELYTASRRGNDDVKVGDLRKAQMVDVDGDGDSCMDDLKTWSAGIDGLGALLMLAVGTVR